MVRAEQQRPYRRNGGKPCRYYRTFGEGFGFSRTRGRLHACHWNRQERQYQSN